MPIGDKDFIRCKWHWSYQWAESAK